MNSTKRLSPASPRLPVLPLRTPRGVGPLLRAVALGMALVAVPTGMAAAQDRPLAERPVPTIRVQGEGKISIAPDMAIVGLTVIREAETARAALDANNAAMAEVLAAMKAEGIEDRDLQTSGFSVSPRYTRPARNSSGTVAPPKIAGYSVANALSVRLRDLSRLGAVLDRAVTLGVNSGGNISFGNVDPDPIIEKARAAAMKDAIDRARTLTEAAGVELGPILEIGENYNSPRPMAMARMAAADTAAESVPVATGESTYSVSVNVTWEIAQ